MAGGEAGGKGRDLAAKLPSSIKPVVIDGATHFFPDLYGEEAADAIARFLKD